MGSHKLPICFFAASSLSAANFVGIACPGAGRGQLPQRINNTPAEPPPRRLVILWPGAQPEGAQKKIATTLPGSGAEKAAASKRTGKKD